MVDLNTAPSSSATSFISDGEGTATPPMSKLVEEEIMQSRAIPSSFRESIGYWWASDEADADMSEIRLLRRLPFFKTKSQPDSTPTANDPDPITARVATVSVAPTNPQRYLNTLSMSSPSTASSPNAVVLLHGYGAGLGFFYLNWKALAEASREIGRRSYAVDWLGMGRSARPEPKELHAGKKATTQQRVETAENFFIDSLESWREQQRIEKMTLVGHSLGGYLSAAYAVKYPNRVDRLILLSPAGIPSYDDGTTETAPNPATSNVARELSESQVETTGGKGVNSTGSKEIQASTSTKDAQSTFATVQKAQSDKKGEKKGAPPRLGRYTGVINYAWEAGWSPMSLIRGVWAPFGPQVVGRYSSRRFAALGEEDVRDMHSYIWTISRAKGSGEYAITHLLAPGAYARMPIVDRINKIKVPVAFLYGDRDWMDPQGGYESIKRMRKAGNPNGEVFLVKNAGHHVYLDGAKETNRIMQRLIRETGKQSV